MVRSKNPKSSPYTEKDQHALDEGSRIAHDRYWADVMAEAGEIVDECKDSGCDGAQIAKMVEEGARRAVSYVSSALGILSESPNYNAIDDIGEIPQAAGDAIREMAYWAYHKDLSKRVQSMAEAAGIYAYSSAWNEGPGRSRKSGARKKSSKRNRT